MQKLLIVAFAAMLSLITLNSSFAQAPPPTTTSTDHTGPWVIGCGLLSASVVIVGSEVVNTREHNPRQLTINEAAWLATLGCPVLFPLALLTQATCPDNKATYEVARLAHLFLRKHPVGNQQPFTDAYREACKTGKLSKPTLRTLHRLI